MGRKLPTCLQEQLGLVPSAVAGSLPQAAQSWLCPGGPGADRSALAWAQELQGAWASGAEAGPSGSPFLQASAFSHTRGLALAEGRDAETEAGEQGLLSSPHS